MSDPIDRMLELARSVKYHSDLYYNKAVPEITDAEFDALVDELKELWRQTDTTTMLQSDIAEIRSVIEGVGSKPTYGRKVKHSSVMGSLDKVTTIAELVAWRNKYAPNARLVVSPKIDGCAIRLNYVNGTLVEAATRGDGEIGQDVTDNVRAIASIPKNIPFDCNVEIRGEIIMSRPVFKRLREQGENFANPRNAGTGSLLAKDPKETAARDLSLIAYGVSGDVASPIFTATESKKIAWARGSISEITWVSIEEFDTIEEFEKIFLEWETNRPHLDYEIDGLVVSINDIELQEAAGVQGNRPRGKIAFKFAPEQVEAEIESIDWQVGRTGKLTPMARIKPVTVAGSTISNITLHNDKNLMEMRINVGSKVIIQKAGDIIPQVVRRTSADVNSPRPTVCPSCGGSVAMDANGVSYWCPSSSCPAQLSRRVLHWIKTVDILGVGEGIVDGLCERGFVKDLPDLYYLTTDQIKAVTGGSGSAKKVQEAILSKSEIPLAVFLDGLGIDGLGTTTSKDVAKRFETLDGVLRANPSSIAGLPNIGSLTAGKIVDGLVRLLTANTIQRLRQTVEVQDCIAKSGPLSGMSFVLTGAMSKPRKDIEAAIEAAGGENKSSVSRGVTYLVQADPSSTSAKTQKAAKCGTTVISEEFLWSMMQ